MELKVETHPSPKGVKIQHPKTVFAVPSEKDGVFVFLNRGDLRATLTLTIIGLSESQIEAIQAGENPEIIQSDSCEPNVYKIAGGCLVRAVTQIGMPRSFSAEEVTVHEFTEYAPSLVPTMT